MTDPLAITIRELAERIVARAKKCPNKGRCKACVAATEIELKALRKQ